MTVLQAVALAGGTGRTAKLNGAKLLHQDASGGMIEKHIELKKILQAKLPDVQLEPNDILIIPSSTGDPGRTQSGSGDAGGTMLSVAAVP